MLRRLSFFEKHVGRTFEQQFYPHNPPQKLIEEIWRRLLRQKDKTAPLSKTMPHPKGFVIAILYMLHMESNYENRKPKGRERDLRDRSNRVVFSDERRELCKSFGFWAPCQCNNECGRKWNFANNDGLSRGGNMDRTCAVAKVIAMVGDGGGRGLQKLPGSQSWLATRKTWERGAV